MSTRQRRDVSLRRHANLMTNAWNAFNFHPLSNYFSVLNFSRQFLTLVKTQNFYQIAAYVNNNSPYSQHHINENLFHTEKILSVSVVFYFNL